MNLTKPKIEQAINLLDEFNIDLWLIFVRETPVMADPMLSMVVGMEATWESFFFFSRAGKSAALVGNFDQDDYIRSGNFTEVRAYTSSVRKDLQDLIKEFAPKQIAVNYSLNNPAADGLTHGMYLMLQDYLKDIGYDNKLVTAEEITSRLRSRKLAPELTALEKAARLADQLWNDINPHINVGMTEKEVAELIDDGLRKRGSRPSFDTIVNAGAKTNPGHGAPTSARLEPGDLLHIDFGAVIENYCSDLQRLLYFKKNNEDQAPPELIKAFNCVRDIITKTGEASLPGVKGHEVDALARKILVENGYDEYEHALGHQLGRDVHDGGAILGPKWERYGTTPMIELEKNNVFTLELEIMLPQIGCVGLEEDMYVDSDGATYLCPRQMELIVR